MFCFLSSNLHRLIEQNLHENLSREKKLLVTRQQNELNLMKQTIEKEKQELQKQLRYINNDC